MLIRIIYIPWGMIFKILGLFLSTKMKMEQWQTRMNI